LPNDIIALGELALGLIGLMLQPRENLSPNLGYTKISALSMVQKVLCRCSLLLLVDSE